ncbi:hypothetical protein Tco_1271136 [Tanacetum coccineum]
MLMMNMKSNHNKGDMKVEAKSSMMEDEGCKWEGDKGWWEEVSFGILIKCREEKEGEEENGAKRKRGGEDEFGRSGRIEGRG